MTQWGLDTLFNPAKRHMDEEKRRLQSTREEVGDNSGGKRIDLESGKVRIAANEDAADDAAQDADDTHGRRVRRKDRAGERGGERAGRARESGDAPRRDAGEPTPAQIRAAARRGRKLD